VHAAESERIQRDGQEGGESLSYIAAVNSEDVDGRRTMIGAYIRDWWWLRGRNWFSVCLFDWSPLSVTSVHGPCFEYARRDWKVNCQKHPREKPPINRKDSKANRCNGRMSSGSRVWRVEKTRKGKKRGRSKMKEQAESVRRAHENELRAFVCMRSINTTSFLDKGLYQVY